MQKCLKWPLSNTLASPASQHENMAKEVILFQDSEQLASDPASVFILWFWFFSQMKNVTLHCLHLHLKTIKLKQLHKSWCWLSLRESFTFSFQSHAVNRLVFVFSSWYNCVCVPLSEEVWTLLILDCAYWQGNLPIISVKCFNYLYEKNN